MDEVSIYGYRSGGQAATAPPLLISPLTLGAHTTKIGALGPKKYPWAWQII